MLCDKKEFVHGDCQGVATYRDVFLRQNSLFLDEHFPPKLPSQQPCASACSTTEERSVVVRALARTGRKLIPRPSIVDVAWSRGPSDDYDLTNAELTVCCHVLQRSCKSVREVVVVKVSV